MRKYWKYLYLIAVIFLFFNLISDNKSNVSNKKSNEIRFSDFIDKAKNGEIESVVIRGDMVEGTLKAKNKDSLNAWNIEI